MTTPTTITDGWCPDTTCTTVYPQPSPAEIADMASPGDPLLIMAVAIAFAACALWAAVLLGLFSAPPPSSGPALIARSDSSR